MSDSGDVFGLTAKGGVRANANPDKFATFRIPNTEVAEVSEASIKGTLADYAATLSDEEHKKQLRNNVRKCGVCGKPCAFTLTICNGCGEPLPKEIIYTDNIFMAFVYGVEKGDRFPYSISLRKQTEDLLVFDDPLALTACHFCAIPTNYWAADWRILLRNPKKGLEIMKKLEDAAWSCVEEQFLSNEAWCNKFIKAERIPKTDKDREFIRDCVAVGCNYPPSQFQLHIQYFLMPWLPSYYKPFLEDGMIIKKRWFPLRYIKKVLELNDPMDVQLETPIDDVLAKYDDRVNYETEINYEIEHIAESHKALAKWEPGDFGCSIETVDGKEVIEGEAPEGQTAKQITENDKKILHSSGPTKTYYKHTKKHVEEFGKTAA